MSVRPSGRGAPRLSGQADRRLIRARRDVGEGQVDDPENVTLSRRLSHRLEVDDHARPRLAGVRRRAPTLGRPYKTVSNDETQLGRRQGQLVVHQPIEPGVGGVHPVFGDPPDHLGRHALSPQGQLPVASKRRIVFDGQDYELRAPMVSHLDRSAPRLRPDVAAGFLKLLTGDDDHSILRSIWSFAPQAPRGRPLRGGRPPRTETENRDMSAPYLFTPLGSNSTLNRAPPRGRDATEVAPPRPAH